MNRLPIALFVLFMLSSPAGARLIVWEATSGLLPWDPAVPEDARFAVYESVEFASLTTEAMRINDDVVADRILADRFETFGSVWALQIDARIIDAERPGLPLALQCGIADGSRYVPLGVTPEAVGFVNSNGSGWIEGTSYAMDTTDGVHRYDIQQLAGQVRLFIDGSANPVFSIPVESFSTSTISKVLLVATSIAGTAEFEIESFQVETGLDWIGVPDAAGGWDLRAAPNPFNPSTSLAFSMVDPGPVAIDIVDLRGALVRHLLHEYRDAGDHRVAWYGRDDAGRAVASGTYLARMRTAGVVRVRPLLLVK